MRLLGVLFLFPYVLGFAPQDTSYTDIQIGAGGGQYIYSDCGGVHSSKFYDAGVRVIHKFNSPWRAGISAGSIPSDNQTLVFAYPDFAFDNGYVSLGTTGLRFGELHRTYFELKGFDEVPFTSGRGFLRLGLSTPVSNDGARIWFGTNTMMYQRGGLAAGAEWPFETNKYMFLNFRYGEYNNIPEYGISLGIRLRN